MNGENEYLLKDIKYIKGVGEARAKLLARLGIFTLYDMLYFFPRYIENRSEIKPISHLTDGETACIQATVCSDVTVSYIRKNMKLYSMLVTDGSLTANMTWFNNKYVKDTFKIGDFYNFYGKASVKFGKIQMTNPTFEPADKNLHTGRVVPVYPLTENLPQKTIRAIAKNCVDMTKGIVQEYLPSYIRKKYTLPEINHAISSIHFPETTSDYESARRRLAFEELLFMQLGLFKIRSGEKRKCAPVINAERHIKDFTSKIPFSLTNAQKNVCREITNDLLSGIAMNRLVQGDVGSGKTIVAFYAMYAVVKEGYQAVLMAPTSVLAEQHYMSSLKYFNKEEVVLLTGSATASAKKKLLAKIESGEAKVIIGTHALISENVKYKNPGLIITDEQHRFGVKQRAALAEKGSFPHILVMSATPIPRTLTLILYGDLDISIINELPPGRKTVDTFSVNESYRKRIEAFIDSEISKGRQAFIVCPLALDSEKIDLESAKSLHERLSSKVFPDRKVALLHGKMKPAEKNDIMTSFSSGEIDILVSTTVIEVGINVPNATLMVIENAERFGLSTLHQLRGRVGRGSDKAYCILISDSQSAISKERLSVMCMTNDGFVIANKDLELRGPGDILGTRQHGLPDLKIANLASDGILIKEANICAKAILEEDFNLEKPEHKYLKKKINELFQNEISTGIIS